MSLQFQLPENLDNLSLDPEDLRQWASTLQLKRAELGVGVSTSRLLVAYACNVALAMEYRLDGRITEAQRLEYKNERIFARIPQKFQW